MTRTLIIISTLLPLACAKNYEGKAPVDEPVGAAGARSGEAAEPTTEAGQPLAPPPPVYEEPDVHVTVPGEGDIIIEDDAGTFEAVRPDLTIAADIRRALVEQEGLSASARNVGIAVTGGVVTLSGAVESRDEMALVDALARATAGVAGVDNQLTIISGG